MNDSSVSTTKTVTWSSSIAEIHYFMPPEKSLKDRIKRKLAKIKQSLSLDLDGQRLGRPLVLLAVNPQLNSASKRNEVPILNVLGTNRFSNTENWDELFERVERNTKLENMSRFSASAEDL